MSTGGSIDHGTTTVAMTATLINAGRSLRKGLIVQNVGANDLYIGGSAVTTANGIKVTAGSSIPLGGLNGPVYGISSSGNLDVRWMGVY